jgi:hypothetical protein
MIKCQEKGSKGRIDQKLVKTKMIRMLMDQQLGGGWTGAGMGTKLFIK